MQNFDYSIPTKIFFGKGQIEKVKYISKLGTRVLMVYGGGSIKKNGVYDDIVKVFKENEIDFVELAGVEPNPRIETVEEGVRLCIENDIDAVLAVGGGSTIDCAKVIAAAAVYNGPAWDLVLDGSKIRGALPVATVLTIAATGSEMDGFAVISDMKKNDKLGTGSPYLKPKFSILDPTYTFSVSERQTAAGTADMMSHVFEVYFTPEKSGYLQARMCEAVLQTAIQYGPVAMKNPENYEARANLMWASSLAINGLLSYGSAVEWSVHNMEHELSAYYDITHGVGLAILTPYWMEYVLSDETMYKFVELGKNVWHLNPHQSDEDIAKQAIAKTREFFNELGLPSRLSEVGIGEEHLAEMAAKLDGQYTDTFVPLTGEQILEIYKMSL